MDLRERFSDPEEMLRTLQDDLQHRLWTALPGKIKTYDAQKQVASVILCVKGRSVDANGKITTADIPDLPHCPVLFPSGGGITLTFPIKAGDECLVVFSCRSIDEWYQTGDAQPAMDARQHDLSDGFVIPGIRSSPHGLKQVSSKTFQLRSDDGKAFLEIDPASHKINILAPAGLSVKGDVSIDGNLKTTGDIKANGDVTAGKISLKNHTHSGVKPGPSSTSPPQ